MKVVCVFLFSVMAVAGEAAQRLAPLEAEPLPLGAIKPAGWLKRQLEIQANGLSGHLDEFWPDVAESSWIGGKAEGWERGPYWLDGFVPLAILLDNKDFKARAQKWIDYVLKTQKDDGWLGPLKGNPDPNSRLSQFDVWPRFILLKAMTQWQEATGDPRIIPAMKRFLKRLDPILDEKPLAEWARVRWADLSLSIYWLYDRTREPWLLDLATKVHRQGLDWAKLGRDYPYHEKVTRTELEKFKDAAGGQWINDDFGATHGVNIAMGVKAAGVWSRQSGNKGDFDAAVSLLEQLDKYHGQATGMFAADEHIAGRHPSQGTELCAVVEMMFSIENLLAIRPHVGLADRLESVAFNALPATFSDDMWAHQYDQQANQVVCKISKERVYSNNGPESNLFGLEPTFGCCLANMHQGWPKFVSHLWMKTKDNGLIAFSYAPCDIQTKDAQVKVRTDYPFNDQIDITVKVVKAARFPVVLRIPEWAGGATVSIAGKEEKVKAATFHRIDRRWSGETAVTLALPMRLRTEKRFNDAVVIKRGPLLLALQIGQDWRKLRDKKPTADWEVHPMTPWNYAIWLNQDAMRVETAQVGHSAFSPTSPPIRLHAKARKVPEWELVKNAADAPPKGPIKSEEPLEDVVLIPYGSAKLRVTEFPVLSQ
ncbi:MAG TPA: beta-L-arabinofuranosidase domain-containing protein [Verrucomicrobiae bacterium]|nr:beta-L-arabinofuranosidase domain-containing protein [Verrucomicrobiae bacterium]